MSEDMIIWYLVVSPIFYFVVMVFEDWFDGEDQDLNLLLCKAILSCVPIFNLFITFIAAVSILDSAMSQNSKFTLKGRKREH